MVEDGLTIELGYILRMGRRPRRGSWTGSLKWSWGRGGSASIGYRISLDEECLTLNYVVGKERRPIVQHVRLTTTDPHFGGVRRWMVCPATRKRCGKLYNNSGSDLFLSREALGLAYRSQREDDMDRALRRGRKALERLGGTGDMDECRYLPKPKGMHWRTYDREMAKARRANQIFLVAAAAQLGLRGRDRI